MGNHQTKNRNESLAMLVVSIIIPCYNSFSKMQRCLQSLEAQACRDFECIFVDDCSTDDTYQHLKNYQAVATFPVKLLRNDKNSGPGPTRNRGITEAEGDFILFLDSDDFIAANTLAALLESQKICDADCVIFNYFFYRNGISLPRDTLSGSENGQVSIKRALVFSNGSTCGKLYRREVIYQQNIVFPAITRSEDFVFTKLAIAASKSVYYLKQGLYYYVMSPDSLMHDDSLLSTEYIAEAFKILKPKLEESHPEEWVALNTKNLFYATVSTMVKQKRPAREIIDYINTYEETNPAWYRSKFIKSFGVYPRILLCFMKHRWVLGIHIAQRFKELITSIK